MNYLPNGWSGMSPEGLARYRANEKKIEQIARQGARRYLRLPSMDRTDVLQEARIAAAYACETYRPEAGSIDRYMRSVVRRALAYFAEHALALKRRPHVSDGEQSIVCESLSLDESAVDHKGSRKVALQEKLPAPAPLPPPSACEAAREDRWVRDLRGALSADAAALLGVTLRPSAELLVFGRNTTGRGGRLEQKALAEFFGWDRRRVASAARELRLIVAAELGREGENDDLAVSA